jgi:hypothetical protein
LEAFSLILTLKAMMLETMGDLFQELPLPVILPKPLARIPVLMARRVLLLKRWAMLPVMLAQRAPWPTQIKPCSIWP